MLARLVSTIFILITMVYLNILVSIHGWGLEPKSWGWIIGVGFFVQIFIKFLGDAILRKNIFDKIE